MILFRVIKTFFLVMGLGLALTTVILIAGKGLQRFFDWAWG